MKSAIDAIRCAAFDYLVKPVNKAELFSALERLRSRRSPVNESHYQALIDRIPPYGRLSFPTGCGFVLLNPEDIVYINADWNYSELFLSDGRSMMITTNLGNLEKTLPDHIFYRINRSTIINLAYLTSVNRKKRNLTLTKKNREYTFPIPLLNIRKMERKFMGSLNSK